MRESIFCSIIIPIYNGSKFITQCLDSIYKQDIPPTEFEVICVDDVSTDSTVTTVEKYKYKGDSPDNLKLVKNDVNKKRGGAVNTGFKEAKGKWLISIDCDDAFVEGKLKELIQFIQENDDMDMIAFDFKTTTKEAYYSHLSTERMNGCEYIKRQAYSWTAWNYALKKALLTEHNIEYVEGVYFEDADFVTRALLAALSVQYVPLIVINYNVREGQISQINNNYTKIYDIFKLATRLKQIADETKDVNMELCKTIMNHHLVLYKSSLYRYIWRLKYKEIIDILGKNRPSEMDRNFSLVNFSARHTKTFAFLSVMGRPVLKSLTYIRHLFVKRHL